MSKEKAASVRVVTSSGGVVAQRCSFATPQAAYANPLRSANFYIILNNYAICASAHGSSRPAGRIIQIMQKSAGSVPRPTSLSGVLCGRYAVGLCRKRQDRLSFAQAGENASGCPPARRARLGCDCSSLSPLTLKPLRSPTPCPFTAIATAFNVRLRRTRGSAVNSHGFGGCGSWLQRRQPSTMSAGCFLGFDKCRAPPPSRPLRGFVCILFQ